MLKNDEITKKGQKRNFLMNTSLGLNLKQAFSASSYQNSFRDHPPNDAFQRNFKPRSSNSRKRVGSLSNTKDDKKVSEDGHSLNIALINSTTKQDNNYLTFNKNSAITVREDVKCGNIIETPSHYRRIMPVHVSSSKAYRSRLITTQRRK